MNFELADKLSELLESQKLDEAIAMAEQELKNIPTTGFHKILDKNLLHLTSDLAKHINEFDKSTKEVLKKKKDS
jgi:protein involved in temperature-dependent protein secretion